MPAYECTKTIKITMLNIIDLDAAMVNPTRITQENLVDFFSLADPLG